ncbi:MAG: protein kinase [Candidatus Aminicenantes bacterium]|nr:protein kinase [Candidatus Aminicenantes bacterium]
MIGKTISHYKILEKIGEGGMGIVYKAEDTKLRREVALKFLPKEFTADPEAKERFVQEAQAAAALDHPNICTVYEIDEIDGRTFIVMAYIEGQNLKDRFKPSLLELEEALAIAIQVADGLQEAHEKGIIHRDIKPANIMLTTKGQAKIMDFGLAKLSWGVDLTKTATIMGTAAYMSPEQVKGGKVDHRTDIWSLGAMLYEMLTGERPFKVTHDQAVLYAILNEDPVPITKIRKDIPQELEKIVKKSLEKDPKKRYGDMDAMLDDLKSVGRKSVSTVADKPSIAVLPFVNMSADPENEYFSDGLAEDLINALTKITDLHVVARTSSFAFKGEKVDIREIGEKLNVDSLLEGSVRKVGNRIRITAQLIKVKDGYHLWSDRYDRNMEDVFAIQDEITEKIMDKLMIALDVLKKPPEEHRPVNFEAYDLYLKGRYCLNKFEVDRALTYYEQAIEQDPNYALAYASIAEVYTLLSTGFDILPNKDAMPKARDAAQKALELDPNLAEAYVSLGLVALSYDWDRKATKKYFQKAIELNPNSAVAYQWFEFYWTYMMADLETATVQLERALELDPLNFLIKIRLGFMDIFKGDYESAINKFEALYEFEPNYGLLYLSLATAYALKGDYDEAIAYGEKMLEVGPRAVAAVGNMGWLYASAGKKEKVYELLAELEERSKKGYVSSFWIALIYIVLGEIDKSFAWFEKAYEERDGNMIYFTVVPVFGPVKADPRYKKLLLKMGHDNLIQKCTR